jgi:hypothetical protein
MDIEDAVQETLAFIDFTTQQLADALEDPDDTDSVRSSSICGVLGLGRAVSAKLYAAWEAAHNYAAGRAA